MSKGKFSSSICIIYGTIMYLAGVDNYLYMETDDILPKNLEKS
jgi:hypothetical protein